MSESAKKLVAKLNEDMLNEREEMLSEKGPIAVIKSEVQQARAEQEQGKNEQQDKEKIALQMVLSLPHPSAPEILHIRPQALPVWSLIGIWYTHAGKA